VGLGFYSGVWMGSGMSRGKGAKEWEGRNGETHVMWADAIFCEGEDFLNDPPGWALA
jgi:hypothetical protein